MQTVYIFLPASVLSASGTALYGQARCHPHWRSGLPACTLLIHNDRQQLPSSTQSQQRLGFIIAPKALPKLPLEADDAFYAIFSKAPDTGHPYLRDLQVPDLTEETHVHIITFWGAIPRRALAPFGTDLPLDDSTAQQKSQPSSPSLLVASAGRCSAGLEAIGFRLPVVRHTAVFQHLLARFALLRRPNGHTIAALAVDTLAGLLLTAILLHIGHPYFLLTEFTEAIVVSVRQLLAALKGFPIGLKLNIELNNFLLGIFTYHIDLWVTFLVLVAPLLHWLFVPFVVLGALGVSMQLAVLADLLVFISLHAHCFYIYVAVLYHSELAAIDSLWRVLRGMRHNQLKSRVESHDYSNTQLYLATMFFTSSLFLLPTVLMYYVVFAFLRFCVYCTTFVLIAIQRRVLKLPVYAVGLKIWNVFSRSSDQQHLQTIPNLRSDLPNPVTLTTYVESPTSSCPPETHFIDAAEASGQPEMLSVFQFFMALVRGQIMGFILPLGKPRIAK